jgi:hypothetical protein
MPYYLFRIEAGRRFTLLGEHAVYRDARARARELRAMDSGVDPDSIRIVFADDRERAAELLTTPREREPSDDD